MSDMTIKLSKETVDTLSRVFEVNQSVRLIKDADILKVKSIDGTALVHAPLADKFPRTFNIYDVSEFLSVLKIIDNPILDFSNDSFVEIRSEDGKQKIRYIESDEEYVTSYTDKMPNMGDPDIQIQVSEQQFTSVMKAAKTMKLDFVGFVANGEKVSLSAFKKNNETDNDQTNLFSIELMETDETFEMFYKLESQNISVLEGEGDLVFYITKGKISKIETASGKTFWLAMNINSKWS